MPLTRRSAELLDEVVSLGRTGDEPPIGVSEVELDREELGEAVETVATC